MERTWRDRGSIDADHCRERGRALPEPTDAPPKRRYQLQTVATGGWKRCDQREVFRNAVRERRTNASKSCCSGFEFPKGRQVKLSFCR